MIRARAIVTDVEGTTSSIGFVRDELFPYADARIDAFVASHRDDPVVARALREAASAAGRPQADEAQVLAQLHRWIAEDAKITPLKTLQGLIWDEGYRRNELLGHVYPEVPGVLAGWQARGIALYVYSSGSVQAQRVLFGHTFAGDLTPLFRGHFDTAVGGKREAASYAAIAAQTGFPPGEILFLSDVEEELDAARSAGLQTARLMRPGDTPPGATSAHPAYVDFDALSGDVEAA